MQNRFKTLTFADRMYDKQYIYDQFIAGEMSPFYDRMYSGLLIYASRLLEPELAYMAEDCVQDAVMNTYTHREELYTPEQWYAYLLKCIYNRAVDMMRKNNARRNYTDSNDDTAERDLSLAYIENETLDMLYAAIESLPEKYREIFDLSFEQGLKNAEIAKLLGMAEITVKKRKARLLELLRGKLGGIADDDMLLLLIAVHCTGRLA